MFPYSDQPPLPESISERPTVHLRNDLELLRRTVGDQTLSACLTRQNIQRAVEIGTGGDYMAVRQLLDLTRPDGKPYFSNQDLLWAVDPDLKALPESEAIKKYLSRFTRERAPIQDIAARIKAGKLAPFDLAFSKGVSSIGVLADSTNIAGWRDRGLRIIERMSDCLNPDNPDATIVVATLMPGSVLPYHDKDFQGIGLRIIGFDPSGIEGQDWVSRLQDAGFFPTEPGNNFYNAVVCKKR